MNDLYISRLAQTIHQDRLDAAAEARRWMVRKEPLLLWTHLRMALSARLIAWGEQLQVPSTPIKTH